MAKLDRPLTDLEKNIYTLEEQELLKEGAHIVRKGENEEETAKNFIYEIVKLFEGRKLTEEELDEMLAKVKEDIKKEDQS